MMTDVLTQDVEKAAAIIHSGGIVAFPTETYYGLAVDPFNSEALIRLYALKQRARSKPLLTLISHLDDLDLLVGAVPSSFRPLMELWPAPLTLVFPSLGGLPPELTGGTSTVGVRISPNPVATALVQACSIPLTATSANISGGVPCHTAQMVRAHFTAGLDYILDGGPTPGGAGSTLVGLEDDRPVILRDGVMDQKILASCI